MFNLIYKKQGISSFKCIKQYARENNIKKIGHTGTLDPMAEGLLLIATNSSTKLIQYIKHTTKTYLATAMLGIQTDSYDLEGEVVNKAPIPEITEKQVIKHLNSFLNEETQIPPIFSAKKVDGKRSYKMARAKKDVVLKPIKIDISYIKLISFSNNLIKFEVVVSKGTYIRTIINDLGIKLGTYATMSGLIRTQIGDLKLCDIDEPLDEVNLFSELAYKLTPSEALDIFHGKLIKNNDLEENKTVFLYYENKIFAIAKVQENKLKPIKVIGKIKTL